MGGVKTKREGKALEPRWTVTACGTCGDTIATGKDGIRVLGRTYFGSRVSERLFWAHRKCVNSGGGK
jgi:hypothetical protein